MLPTRVGSPSHRRREQQGFGGDSDRVTPVPIPNTEVKPVSADGTWDVRPWESRTPPDFSRCLRAAARWFTPGSSEETMNSGPASAGPEYVLRRVGSAAMPDERSRDNRTGSRSDSRGPRKERPEAGRPEGRGRDEPRRRTPAPGARPRRSGQVGANRPRWRRAHGVAGDRHRGVRRLPDEAAAQAEAGGRTLEAMSASMARADRRRRGRDAGGRVPAAPAVEQPERKAPPKRTGRCRVPPTSSATRPRRWPAAAGRPSRERKPLGPRPQRVEDPAVVLQRLVGADRVKSLNRKLSDAGKAYQAERFGDARALAAPCREGGAGAPRRPRADGPHAVSHGQVARGDRPARGVSRADRLDRAAPRARRLPPGPRAAGAMSSSSGRNSATPRRAARSSPRDASCSPAAMPIRATSAKAIRTLQSGWKLPEAAGRAASAPRLRAGGLLRPGGQDGTGARALQVDRRARAPIRRREDTRQAAELTGLSQRCRYGRRSTSPRRRDPVVANPKGTMNPNNPDPCDRSINVSVIRGVLATESGCPNSHGGVVHNFEVKAATRRRTPRRARCLVRPGAAAAARRGATRWSSSGACGGGGSARAAGARAAPKCWPPASPSRRSARARRGLTGAVDVLRSPRGVGRVTGDAPTARRG